MKIQQHHFIKGNWKDFPASGFNSDACSLVLAFGSPEIVVKNEMYFHLKGLYPYADIVIASTSGEILDNDVYDDSVVATAMEFDKTKIVSASIDLQQHLNSYETGKYLMQQLDQPDLASVLIISDGTYINGSELVAGFNENNTRKVPVTGGLAGDAARFSKTYSGLNAVPAQGNVIAIGFYGNAISIGHGSFGGWDEFGRERTITKSDKNILYEIDGRNALDLYKEYLGDYVNDLPGSALLFPLSLKMEGSDTTLVRTILSVNEDDKSMIFAGNLPVGSKVRLMKANFDRLIEGASHAATKSAESGRFEKKPEFALLISCVGRKLILAERTYEEVEAVKEIFGVHTCISGFYSYGEISPYNPTSQCELHNQTMTITTFSEN
ncbi:MAG: FIST N-terminal domain-containing protein [Flavipsychrobacter sp.]|nr:FIST N-terminal domain-containing protein [Flavipsychrobacter sp.]